MPGRLRIAPTGRYDAGESSTEVVITMVDRTIDGGERRV